MDKIYYISQMDKKMYNIKDCAHLAHGKLKCFGKHIFYKYGARMEEIGNLMTIQEVADTKEVDNAERIYFVSQHGNKVHNIRDWGHRKISPDVVLIGQKCQDDEIREVREEKLWTINEILELLKDKTQKP